MGGSTFRSLLTIGIALFNPAAALGLSGFAATAFNFVLQSAVSSLVGGDDDSGGGGGRGDTGLLLNNSGSVNAIDVVYGTRLIGGNRVYIQSTNQDGDPSGGTEYLHTVIAFAQGGVSGNTDRIQDVLSVRLNDQVAWDGSSLQGDYADKMDIRIWLGGNDQTVGSPDITALGINKPLSTEWTTNHRLRGIAFAYITIKYDRDVFPALPNILFEIQGKKITDSAGATPSYSTNAARVLYDYLRSERYGKGLSAADIADWSEAETYCANNGINLNGAVRTNQKIFQNVQQILTSSNLNLVFSGGQYKIVPNKKITNWNVFDFNKSNIIGQWQISMGNKKTRFNTIVANYFDAADGFQPSSVRLQPSAYLSADSDQVNQTTVDFQMISNKAQVERLARFLLDISRYQTVVSFRASHEALKLDVGDPVTITHDTPGWDPNSSDPAVVKQSRFRVNSIVLRDDSTVDVTLTQYAPHEDITYLEDS